MKKILNLIDITNINRISFRKDINGLRGIAVLAVVFYHAEIELFKGGWLGVDLFFVISGYLISNIIISELNNEIFSLKNFYLRRIRRILPALFFTLLLSIPFSYFLLTPKAMEEFVESLMSSLFFYANYHFMNLDFYIAESAKLMPLLHTWSLAIEEQYYLLFPLFSIVIYKYFRKYFTVIIGLLAFISLYINTLSQDVSKFYRLEYRVWEMLVGVLLMIISNNIKVKHLEKVGLPLIILSFFYFDDSWINDTEPKLIAILGISLIIFSNTENTKTTDLLSLKPISLIGLSSYSIYLLHQPLFAFYRIFLENYNLLSIKNSNLKLTSIDIYSFELAKFNINNIEITNALLLALLILIGYLSYFNIELKVKRIKLIFFMFILNLLFVSLQTNSTKTFIVQEDSRNFVTEETVLSEYNCWKKIESLDNSIQKLDECIIFNNSKKYLIIIGDSSSVAIHKSILQNSFSNNYNFIFVSMDFESFFKPYSEFNSCDNCFIDWMKKNKENITTVVSVELHRWIEKEGIYQSPTSLLRSSDIFLSNMDIVSNASNKLILIEPFQH